MNAAFAVGCALASLALSACQPEGGAAAAAPLPETRAAPAATMPTEREPDGMPKRYSVVPYGYNYTANYIDSFEVDGAGGGNLAVSTRTAPGGGHTCCMTLVSGLPLGTPFVINWTAIASAGASRPSSSRVRCQWSRVTSKFIFTLTGTSRSKPRRRPPSRV